MQPEPQRVGPVGLSERILFIDILRGMALFGILAANMRAFFAPLDAYGNIGVLFHSRADVLTQAFIDLFIQGKFISIFSFLFGMGFAIQLSRAEARGVRFMGFYPRRLLALALFGLIHGLLIWAGDILLTYAVSGAILLFFRKRQQKTLLWWAGSLFAVPIVVSTTFLVLYFSRFRRPWMNPAAGGAEISRDHQYLRAWHGPADPRAELGRMEASVALHAVRDLCGGTIFAGYVGVASRHRATAGGIQTRIEAGVRVVHGGRTDPQYLRGSRKSGCASRHRFAVGLVCWTSVAAGIASLSAGYTSGLALIFLHADWRRFVLPFAAVGRMALTDYLMQSVLCTLFFYHYTTGLYGRVGPALGLVPTVILYAAQVVFSNWWLQRYRFGPMEWLWRGMTYGTLPSMRKEEALVEIGAPRWRLR